MLAKFKAAVADTSKKLDYQHYLLVAVLAITILGPDIAKMLGSNGMTKQAAIITNLVAFLTGILALAKQAKKPPTAFPAET